MDKNSSGFFSNAKHNKGKELSTSKLNSRSNYETINSV